MSWVTSYFIVDPAISSSGTATGQENTAMEPSLGQDNTTIQPSTGQDNTAIQPTTGQDNTTMQPSTGQDNTTMQPSLGQDNTAMQPTTGQDNTITVSPVVSSDDEVKIIDVQQQFTVPLINIESSDEDEKGRDTSTSNNPDDSNKELQKASSLKVEQTCSICLGEFDNKAFLDHCFHAFCFYCILQWAEIVKTCPLCKAAFSQIIHSVKSMTEYELHIPSPKPNFPKAGNTPRRFRYRTTSDRSRHVPYRTSAATAWDERERRRETMLTVRRRKDIRAKEKRKSIYARNLWVQTVTQTGRPKFRDTSPQFYRSNSACTHRLVPWLTRELQCLLSDEPGHVDLVLQLIMTIITKLPIDSDDFIDQLRPFLTDKTEHFAHEFFSYARSPFDMITYDERAQYNWTRESAQAVAETPLVVADISATGWDSPDESGTSSDLAALSIEPGPSGVFSSIEVVNESSLAVSLSIDPSRELDSADWSDVVTRRQTVSLESDQNRNDVIDLSPEVKRSRLPSKEKHHRHKHKNSHKPEHQTIVGGDDLEGCRQVFSQAQRSPVLANNPVVDIIVVSSEGTGSPECIELSPPCVDSSSQQTPSESRSSRKACKSSKSYRRRSRGSEPLNSHEDRPESSHRNYNRKKARRRDDAHSSRGHPSRDHSRQRRSRSSSADSRTGKTTSKPVSKFSFESHDSSEEGARKPSSPSEEEMKQEILELEKKIAEGTKRLDELIKKQKEKKQCVDTKYTE